MTEDDKSRQEEEIEALASIYGEDWTAIDCENGQYKVCISNENPQKTVMMEIQLPVDYPSISPPHYQLSVPWLRGEERQKIDNALSDIVCENLGECVLYLWIEKIRELIETSESSASAEHKELDVRKLEEEEESIDLSVLELCETSKEDQPDQGNELEYPCPEIIHGEAFMDRKSRFQGHIAMIIHTKQVKLILEKLCENKKIAEATHNIYAYRIYQNGLFYQGCEDDGEIQAGSRLLHLLQIIDARNVMVVVTRWYGGIHLGPDRFKHINNCARMLLDQEGYIKSKEEKKGPKSSKKKR